MTRYITESPPVVHRIIDESIINLCTQRLRPDDAVDIVFLVLINETISCRIYSCDFFALKDVERVYAGSPVPMSPERVNISK